MYIQFILPWKTIIFEVYFLDSYFEEGKSYFKTDKHVKTHLVQNVNKFTQSLKHNAMVCVSLSSTVSKKYVIQTVHTTTESKNIPDS